MKGTLRATTRAERALADARRCEVCKLPVRELQRREIPTWACTKCYEQWRRHRGYQEKR